MNRCLILLFFVLMSLSLKGQVNIIPNPGFEEYSNVPLGWFYSGKDFSTVMRYWFSATAASPDVYGPKVFIPKHWRDKGFGDVQPHSGYSMVGITTYGCKEGKPHCREYVQIQLSEPTVQGQRYALKFWYQPLAAGISNNRIGIYLSEYPINEAIDSVVVRRPHAEAAFVLHTNGIWKKFEAEWIAPFQANYLTIGNFTSDQYTDINTSNSTLPFGYYYIDDVSMIKIPPIVPVPIERGDLSLIKPKKGKTITLKNIYFDLDKSELLPRSHIELNKLVDLMNQFPKMEIEIRGHTDNTGTTEYNQDLSILRARAVSEYLQKQDISPQRLTHQGYGASMPIAKNKNTSGRQRNRRVEIFIKKL